MLTSISNENTKMPRWKQILHFFLMQTTSTTLNLNDEESGRSTSIEMDLDEEKMNGTRSAHFSDKKQNIFR